MSEGNPINPKNVWDQVAGGGAENQYSDVAEKDIMAAVLNSYFAGNPEAAAELQEVAAFMEAGDDPQKAFLEYLGKNPGFFREKGGEVFSNVMQHAATAEFNLRDAQIKSRQDWVNRYINRDSQFQDMKMQPLQWQTMIESAKGAIGSILEALGSMGLIDQKYVAIGQGMADNALKWGDKLNEVDEKHDIGLDDKTGANATDEMNALSGNFNEQVIMNEGTNALNGVMENSNAQIDYSQEELADFFSAFRNVMSDLPPEQMQEIVNGQLGELGLNGSVPAASIPQMEDSLGIGGPP